MKTPLIRGEKRQDRARAGFTLIELLAVMTIILILAGLILAIAGGANYKGALARAQSEVQALTAAIESYKTDNGAYPRITAATSGSKNTDGLDPRTNFDPNAPASPNYSATSLIIYQLLSGAFYLDSTGNPQVLTPGTTPQPTRYYTFTDSQLANSGGITSGYIKPETVTAINDPFGLSYGYSTAYQADLEAHQTTAPVVGQPPYTPTKGYNPTYDLWSTAGYSKTAGKQYPTNVPQNSYYTLWVKNW